MHSLSCLVVAVLFAVACGDNYPATDPDGGPKRPQCNDAIDNDHDGARDFPDDPGCDSESDESEDSPSKSACSDNRDNDGDGKKDYPNDPGCQLPQSDSEVDNCPSSPGCPQCANGRDDDFNGKSDYPNDMGCESAADTIEFLDDPDACGANTQIKFLPPNGMDMGTFDVSMSLSNLITPCGGGAGSPAYAYVLSLGEPKIIVASTDHAGTTADTVLDLRSSMCSDPSAHIACHDDVSPPGNFRSKLTASLQPGIYYLIVEGHDTTVTGDYQLTVQQFAGEGASCTMQSDCGPGLVCRVPAGGTNMICTQPVCNDGLDDDADGKIDYPNDPGCDGATDATENDDCPAGPNCPDCGDGVDNDLDGQTDYPMDTNCLSANATSESCVTTEPIVPITTRVTMGTTVGATNDFNPTCNSTTGTAPDVMYSLNLPAMVSLTLNVTGFDSALTLLDSTCMGQILCSDPQLATASNLAAGTYYVSLEAWGSGSSAFTITAGGVVANGQSCEGALFQDGAFACQTGFTCDGPVGARTCRPAQCSDGIDNNSDGKTDYPNDPGCSSTSDNTEVTVCPGAMCPVCADGADNDLDGQTDYPMDTSCPAASGSSESCITSESIAPITAAVTTGTTVGATNDFDPSCNATSGVAPDVLYSIDLPAMAVLTLNITNTPFFDSALSLLNASCTGEILCRDPELATITNLAAGTYFVSIEAWGSGSSPFTLTTGGQVAPGGSCEGQLFQTGVITCSTGFSCNGPVGARTCRTECSDGIDNNGDGKIDFPNDPGCTSFADGTENLVCPGVMCPACSNTMDDDTDALTDWPADFGCTSAAGPTEAFCAVEPNYAGAITMPVINGTLAAPAADNYEQSCQGNTGNDVVYSLSAPVAALWLFTTEGSTLTDSVLSVTDANCGPSIACDDDSGTGFLSVISTSLPAGNYAIQVDSYLQTGNNLPFQLHVTGVAVPGAACTSPLFASGVLACATGQTCTAGVCQ